MMRLANVSVKNFRSIKDATMADCGNLNVLIGKNNSGKSNALSALEVFFKFFSHSGVAVQDSNIRGTDWFEKNPSRTISIAVEFDLDSTDAEVFRDSIGQSAPQMRNVLNEIPLNSKVVCEVSFAQKKQPIAYISNISFLSGGDREGNPASVHPIFILPLPAASEIASVLQRKGELERRARQATYAVERFDLDDWQIFKSEPSRGNYRIRRLLQGEGSAPAMDILLNAVESTSNVTAFKEMVRGQAEVILEEARSLAVKSSRTPFQAFSGEVTEVPSYVELFVDMVGKIKVHSLSEDRPPIGEAEAAEILKLKMSRGHGERLRDLQATVRSLLGVEIDAFASDEPATASTRAQRGGVPAELDVDEFLVQINGSGIRQSLRLILDYEFQAPDIIFIEEPEVYLHPALEIAVLQYLKQISKNCQVFLTTHSTNFLDTAELRNVYLVTRSEGATQLQLLKVDEAEDSIPEELGIRLSSLFMYDRLVFVEGPSDEHVFREFSQVLGVNLAQAGVGFIATGGARNFAHYATASTLRFLSKRRVKVFFIIDRDERDSGDVDKLESLLGGMGEIFVLQRRELENYLVSPSVLLSFIEKRSTNKAVNAPKQEDITQVINEVCDRIKDSVIARRVAARLGGPIFLNREAIRAGTGEDLESVVEAEFTAHQSRMESLKESARVIVQESKSEIEASWQSHKLELAPGEELLRGILKRYGINFKKTRDAADIARLFAKDAVPEELKRVLIRIGS